MYIEKNIFDNVINTVMDVAGKTKDNLNARKDMRNICDQPTLDVDASSRESKPKAVIHWIRSRGELFING